MYSEATYHYLGKQGIDSALLTESPVPSYARSRLAQIA